MSQILSYFYECGDCGTLQRVVSTETRKGGLGLTIGHLACGHQHIMGENIIPLDGLYEFRNGEWYHLTTEQAGQWKDIT